LLFFIIIGCFWAGLIFGNIKLICLGILKSKQSMALEEMLLVAENIILLEG